MASQELLQASTAYLNKKAEPFTDLNGITYVRFSIPIRKKLMAVGLATVSIILPDGSIGYLLGCQVMSPIELKYKLKILQKEIKNEGFNFFVANLKNEASIKIRKKVRFIGGYLR